MFSSTFTWVLPKLPQPRPWSFPSEIMPCLRALTQFPLRFYVALCCERVAEKQYIELTVIVTLCQIQSNDSFYPQTKDDVQLTSGQEKAPMCLCWMGSKQQQRRQHIYCSASVAQLCLREEPATRLIYSVGFHSKQLTFLY